MQHVLRLHAVYVVSDVHTPEAFFNSLSFMRASEQQPFEFLHGPHAEKIAEDSGLGDDSPRDVQMHLHHAARGARGAGEGVGRGRAEILFSGAVFGIRQGGDVCLLPGRNILPEAGNARRDMPHNVKIGRAHV